jgi:hypothetical protein
VSTSCKSTLADIRFWKSLLIQTRRISPTTTQTLAARLVFTSGRVRILVSTPNRAMARYGARVQLG